MHYICNVLVLSARITDLISVQNSLNNQKEFFRKGNIENWLFPVLLRPLHKYSILERLGYFASRRRFSIPIHYQIIITLIAGGFSGYFFPAATDYTNWIGVIFLRALNTKMVFQISLPVLHFRLEQQ